MFLEMHGWKYMKDIIGFVPNRHVPAFQDRHSYKNSTYGKRVYEICLQVPRNREIHLTVLSRSSQSIEI